MAHVPRAVDLPRRQDVRHHRHSSTFRLVDLSSNPAASSGCTRLDSAQAGPSTTHTPQGRMEPGVRIGVRAVFARVWHEPPCVWASEMGVCAHYLTLARRARCTCFRVPRPILAPRRGSALAALPQWRSTDIIHSNSQVNSSSRIQSQLAARASRIPGFEPGAWPSARSELKRDVVGTAHFVRASCPRSTCLCLSCAWR